MLDSAGITTRHNESFTVYLFYRHHAIRALFLRYLITAHGVIPTARLRAHPPVCISSYYMIGNFFGEFSEETLSVISPINYNYRVRGYLVIHTAMNSLRAQAEEVLNIMYLTLAVLLLIALVVLLIYGHLIYSPLRKITDAAAEYAAGNLNYQIDLNTDDEFGRLADSMNYMAKELNDMEQYEQKFVANISHDFRSPLTSIKGYVEAMMDGTIPVEFQEKYFNIVLFETDRLKKLTEELLTLGSFGSKRGMLDITTFDINAVIKNTVVSFEGQCRQRKISIDLLFEHEGKYYILDWKSNLLQDYKQDTLKDSMVHSFYQMQYLIYLTALMRFLKQRLGLPEFGEAEYDKYIGGAYYIYMRGAGADPDDPRNGVYFDRPAYSQIQEVEGLLK